MLTISFSPFQLTDSIIRYLLAQLLLLIASTRHFLMSLQIGC